MELKNCWCQCKKPLKQQVVYGKCYHGKCAPGISGCRCHFLCNYPTTEQTSHWLHVKLNQQIFILFFLRIFVLCFVLLFQITFIVIYNYLTVTELTFLNIN